MTSFVLMVMFIAMCYGANVLTDAECKMPAFPGHGRLEMPNRNINGTVTYFCNPGYWYTGTNPQVCQETGQWSGTRGVCEEVQCPILQALIHGKALTRGRQFKDTTTLVCDEGYYFSDHPSNPLVCLGNNSWSYTTGSCEEVNCPELPDMPHSITVYTGRGYKDKASLKCDEGYMYNKHQSGTRTCQGNNTWSPKEFGGECQVLSCNAVPKITNGNSSSTNNTYGSSVTFSCQPGYILQGNDRIRCQADENWSDEPGWCLNGYMFFTLLLIIPVVLMVLYFCVWKRKSCKCGSNSQNRRYSTVCCCSLTLCQDNPEAKDPEMSLVSRREDTLNNTVGTDVSVSEDVAITAAVETPMRASMNVQPKSPESPNISNSAVQRSPNKRRIVHHCSFILEDKFDAGDPESPKYTSFASSIEHKIMSTLQQQTKTKTKVSVKLISQRKRMVFVSITPVNELSENEIKRALMLSENELTRNSFHICPDTLHFNDDVSTSLMLDIVHKGHIAGHHDKRINIDTEYIELKMLTQNEMTTVLRDDLEKPHRHRDKLKKLGGKVVLEREIIAPGETRKYILIRGRAAIGKTTLIHHLMWKWAHGEWGSHIKAVFLLNFWTLMEIAGDMDLPSLLSEYAIYRGDSMGKTLNLKWLKDNEKQIVFVLDGINKIPNFKEHWEMDHGAAHLEMEADALFWAFAIIKKICLRASTIIVLSRPFEALSCIKPTMTIEIMGLTRERVLEYVERNVKPERAMMVREILVNQPILMSVASMTYYCAALCQVLQDDIGVTDKLTTYTQITAYIMHRFMFRSLQEQDTDISSSFQRLCRLAYSGLLKQTQSGTPQVEFDDDDLKKHNIRPEDIYNVRKAGLLNQTEIADATNPEVKHVVSEFLHPSIQEFLAIVGLRMQNPQKVQEALKTIAISGQFNNALLFLCGFAFNKTSETIRDLSEAIGGIHEDTGDILDQLKTVILGVPDDLQVLQMVHESQSPELALHVGQHRFKTEISFQGSKVTVVDVFAMEFMLDHSPSTTKISLCDVGLDHICIKELGKFLKGNHTVETVSLRDEGLDDGAVHHLAEGLRVNRALKELWISSKDLTDKAVVDFATALMKNTTLEKLALCETELNEKGTDAILKTLEANKRVIFTILGATCSSELKQRLEASNRIVCR